MTSIPPLLWLSLASAGAFIVLCLPYALFAHPDIDGIYERFRQQEPELWRAKGGPGHLSLLPNRRHIGRISRLLRDLDGVSDPELIAQAEALRGWGRYETFVLAPLLFTAMLSGLAWGTMRQLSS